MNWAAAGAAFGLVVGAVAYVAALAKAAFWLSDRYDLDSGVVGPVLLILGVGLVGALFVGAMA